MEAFVSSVQPGEDEHELAGEETGDTTTGTEGEVRPDEEGEMETEATAAVAQLSDTPTSSDIQFHYGHHMLSIFTSALSPGSPHTDQRPNTLVRVRTPATSPPRPRSLRLSDLCDHR